MALARIITRSHQCSRELALDLLARGYAVEIVSPDKIPDNIADLELRVDAGPGDHLTATVEAHDGERSASLEFVHHLKAPMVDFMRRTPEPVEAFHFPEEPVSFDAEPSAEDMEAPANTPQPAPAIVVPAAITLVDSEREFSEPDLEEDVRLIAPPDTLASMADEPPGEFAAAAAMIAAPISQSAMVEPAIVETMMVEPCIDTPKVRTPARGHQRHNRLARLPWRAALTFATVLLLALVLGLGRRRTGKAATQISEVTPAEKVLAASPDVNTVSTPSPENNSEKDSESHPRSDLKKDPKPDPGKFSATAVSQPVMKVDSDRKADSSRPLQKPPAAKSKAEVVSTSTAPKSKASRSHGDDGIARDTVTYLDERYKPAPKSKPSKSVSHQHPSSHKHNGGVIAANGVIYLNQTSPPKPAK